MNEARKKEIEKLVENRSSEGARWVRQLEHAEKCKKIAKKVAQLLAESKAEYNDIDTIFRMTKDFLAVVLVEGDA